MGNSALGRHHPVVKIDAPLLELIETQLGVFPASEAHSTLSKCSEKYLAGVNRRFAKQTSRVEQVDNNYVTYITLEQVKNQVRIK